MRDARAEGGGKGGAGQGQVRGHGLVTGVITSNADTLPSVHLPLSSRPQASPHSAREHNLSVAIVDSAEALRTCPPYLFES